MNPCDSPEELLSGQNFDLLLNIVIVKYLQNWRLTVLKIVIWMFL